MRNRWSDAARAAALAVRQARAFAANPQNKGQGVPQKGVLARKPSPMVYAGGSPDFDESTGTRIAGSGTGPKPVVKVPYANDNAPGNPGLHIWIPPPNAPEWNDPAFVESFKRGVAERKKTGLTAGTLPSKPNIFYSSAVPGPLDRQAPQGILRWDPKRPNLAEELGYNTGKGKSGTKAMPPRRPPRGGGKNFPRGEAGRVIIGGKRYTRVGNKLVPDEVIPGQKKKVFYEMG